MAKLKQKTASTNAAGVKKPRDKVHYGFDVHTGEEGYEKVKSLVADLREGGYSVSDRQLVSAIGSELNKNFEKAVNTIDSTFDDVAQFIAAKTTQEIADFITEVSEETPTPED